MAIKGFTSDGHLQLIERVLGHIVGVKLVNLPYNTVHIWLMLFREQQELCPCEGLKTCQAELGGFEDLDAGSLRGGKMEAGRGEGLRYCVDAGEN